MEILLLIFAFFIPSVTVFFPCGICEHFWINLLLTFFGYLPGAIHAVWYISKRHATA